MRAFSIRAHNTEPGQDAMNVGLLSCGGEEEEYESLLILCRLFSRQCNTMTANDAAAVMEE